MIKYLGSKRRLVPVLGELLTRAEARTALDLFTGTTRVAQEFKRRGAHVWALDSARYSEVLASSYIATDATAVDARALDQALAHLDSLPGRDGYFTETFCRRARYIQPFNGARIDAIRDALSDEFADSPLFPILLTSLLEAADRVDSTTGLQMAYLKSWAPRSHHPLRLRRPELLPGEGTAMRVDALDVASWLPEVDLAYLDPPYNQHSYFRNYHVWETLVAWDAPGHYGVACKREDCRDPATHSPFNSKRTIRDAIARVVADVRARVVVLSYNDEAWIELDDLVDLCTARGAVGVLEFDSRRYVGARIGIHNPAGKRVGRVRRLRNVEYLLVSGEPAEVARMTARGVEGLRPAA
ncbi:MAG: adenine-specific DNA-methyltransferase [Solirubrobacteraceae bacterium]|nr:adenine-specific DNA-methyltransferase [Solirubrobacteraceae bacterium]